MARAGDYRNERTRERGYDNQYSQAQQLQPPLSFYPSEQSNHHYYARPDCDSQLADAQRKYHANNVYSHPPSEVNSVQSVSYRYSYKSGAESAYNSGVSSHNSGGSQQQMLYPSYQVNSYNQGVEEKPRDFPRASEYCNWETNRGEINRQLNPSSYELPSSQPYSERHKNTTDQMQINTCGILRAGEMRPSENWETQWPYSPIHSSSMNSEENQGSLAGKHDSGFNSQGESHRKYHQNFAYAEPVSNPHSSGVNHFVQQLYKLDPSIGFGSVDVQQAYAKFKIIIPTNEYQTTPNDYSRSIIQVFDSILTNLEYYPKAKVACLQVLFATIDFGFLQSSESINALSHELDCLVNKHYMSADTRCCIQGFMLKLKNYAEQSAYSEREKLRAQKCPSPQVYVVPHQPYEQPSQPQPQPQQNKMPTQSYTVQPQYNTAVYLSKADSEPDKTLLVNQLKEQLNQACEINQTLEQLDGALTILVFEICEKLKSAETMQHIIDAARLTQKQKNASEVIDRGLETFIKNLSVHIQINMSPKPEKVVTPLKPHNNDNMKPPMIATAKPLTFHRKQAEEVTPKPKEQEAKFLHQVIPERAINERALWAIQEMPNVTENMRSVINNDREEMCFSSLEQTLTIIRYCNNLSELFNFRNEISFIVQHSQYKQRIAGTLFKKIALRDIEVEYDKRVLVLRTKVKADLREFALKLSRDYIIDKTIGSNASHSKLEAQVGKAERHWSSLVGTLDADTKNELEAFPQWVKQRYYVNAETKLTTLPLVLQECIGLTDQILNAAIYAAGKSKMPSCSSNSIESLRRAESFGFAAQFVIDNWEKQQQLRVKQQYDEEAGGLPLRVCITRMTGNKTDMQVYFENTLKYTHRTSNEKVKDNDLESCRPATLIWQGLPILLYRQAAEISTILVFDRCLIQPVYIFKANACTAGFRKIYQKDVIDRKANNRIERYNTKRLKDVLSLYHKSQELNERFHPREKYFSQQTSGHYSLRYNEWTFPKATKVPQGSRELIEADCLNLNEVLLAPIPPHHTTGTVHYIPPSSLRGNESIYSDLATNIFKHNEAEMIVKQGVVDSKLLLCVYSPYHARLMEVTNMIAIMQGQKIDDTSRLSPKQLIKTCEDLGIERHNQVELLLIRTPLNHQIQFLDALEKKEVWTVNQFAATLWKHVYSQPLVLSTPVHLSSSIQEIIDHFYYLPCSFDETKKCLSQSVQPYELEGKRKPEYGAICAIFCESLCQLLETQGVFFSPQEKRCLIYTVTLLHAINSNEPAQDDKQSSFANIWGEVFKGHFSAEIEFHFQQVLFNLDSERQSTDVRQQMLSEIIQMSVQLPYIWCKNSTVTQSIEDDLLNDNVKNALKCPDYLLELKINKGNKKSKETKESRKAQEGQEVQEAKECELLLTECLHGLIDLMQTLGMEMVQDNRARGFYSDRFTNLKPFDFQYRREKVKLIREKGELWQTCQAQLQENAKRQLCAIAGHRETSFTQLKVMKLHSSFTTLDYLCVNSQNPVYSESIKPIIEILVEQAPKPIFSITHAESEQLNYGNGHPSYHSAVKQIHELEKVESPSKALIKLAEDEKVKRLRNVKFKR